VSLKKREYKATAPIAIAGSLVPHLSKVLNHADFSCIRFTIRKQFQYFSVITEQAFIYSIIMRLKDDSKVARIYIAAMMVINREGFEGSSMAKIAKEADVSAATIYLYFENKEDMLNKLYIYLKGRMGHSYFNKEMDLSASKGTFRTIWLNHYQYILDNIDEYNFLENFSNCPLIERIDKENTLDYCPTFELLFQNSKSSGLLQSIHNDIIYSLLFSPISYMVKKSKSNGVVISPNDLIQIFEASWRAVSK